MGSVQFLDGTTSLGTVDLDSTGTATMTLDTLAVGVHTLTAVYAGQDPFAASTSPATSATITKGSTSTLLTTSNPNVAASTLVTFTATVSPTPTGGTPTGTVTFADGGATIATVGIDGTGVATTQWNSTVLGDHIISAAYSGDGNFAGSASPSITETITKLLAKPILTVVFEPGASVIYGTAVTINVALSAPTGTSGVPTQSVTASIDGGVPLTQSLSSGSASFNLGVSGAGIHNITVAYAGDINFNPVTRTLQLLVLPAPLNVSAGNGTRGYGSENPPFSATVTGLLNGDVITATASTTATLLSPVGIYPVTTTVSDPGNRLGNYTLMQIAGSLTVTPIPVTVTVSPITVAYGQPIPLPSGAISGVLPQDAANVTVAYSIAAAAGSPAGIYGITVGLNGTAARNYTLVVAGTPVLTIARVPLTVKISSAFRLYGAVNPVFTGVVNGLVNKDSVTALYSSTATAASGVGTYPITAVVSGARASNYIVQVTGGVLTVIQAGSSVALSLSNQSTALGSPVTLTAQSTSATSGTPTGTITFLDGSTSLGTAILNAQGSGTLSVSTLTLGTHLLTVSYAGDHNFLQSQSATALETIGTADYTVTTTPATATISAGRSAQFALVLTSLFNYAQPVTLSCTNLPVGATCNFVPSIVTPSSAGTSASLTVTTTAASASLQPLRGWGSALVPTLACCICVALRRRRRLLRLALLLVVLSGVAFTGCGGGTASGGSTTPAATPTPPGTYSITVSSTTGSGSNAHAVKLTVIVTP